MTATYDTDSTSSVKPTLGQIAKATGLAIAVAAIVNIVLYFISAAAGWLPAESTQGTITLPILLTASIVPPIAGAVLYYILTRFLSYARANLVFVVISSIVLIAMAFTPIVNTIDPTVGTVMILQITHLVVGLPTMYFLTNSAG